MKKIDKRLRNNNRVRISVIIRLFSFFLSLEFRFYITSKSFERHVDLNIVVSALVALFIDITN